MFKRVIKVVVPIAAAGIMSEPMAVVVHVRSVRVTGHIGFVPPDSGWRRTVGGNVTAAEIVGAAAPEAVAASETTAATVCAAAATSALSKGGR
jgi:hypothetical protein